MLDIVKEKVTYIIWNNDTNKKINLKNAETEKSIPITLPDNQRTFAYIPGREYDNAGEINKNFVKENEDELYTKMLEMKTKLDNELEGSDIDLLVNTTKSDEIGEFFSDMHFKEKEDKSEISKINNNTNTNTSINFKQIEEFANNAINQYNYPNIYQQHEPPAIVNTQEKPSETQIMAEIMKDPKTRQLIEDSKKILIVR
jgi:dsDNA-binding SOS-regulon protein